MTKVTFDYNLEKDAMTNNKILPGDTVGIIAPSRPIGNIKKEIADGVATLKQLGFKVKKGKNIEKKNYFSAGTVEERVSDIHEMFMDPEVKAIICATGGSSANQLIEFIDFELIKNNPKIFLGYSDIAVLLLSMHEKSGNPVFYGPTIYEMSMLTSDARDFLFKMLRGASDVFKYPQKGEIIRPGKASGKLVGGILSRVESLVGTEYLPNMDGAILFWESVNSSPATIDFELQALRLAGVFEKVNGMIVGHLSECVDKKYPEDNRPIEEIILDRTAGFDFPIIKVEYFGHDINNFYSLPIGAKATIDTNSKNFSILLES